MSRKTQYGVLCMIAAILIGVSILLATEKANPDQRKTRRTLESLNPHVRELVLASLSRTDQKWDERASMLWSSNPETQVNTKKMN